MSALYKIEITNFCLIGLVPEPFSRPAMIQRIPDRFRGGQVFQDLHLACNLRVYDLTKATELAKVSSRDGQRFDSATWLYNARKLPKEEFNREVSKHLTGKETEPWEMPHFKAYERQSPVIEQAPEKRA